MVGPEAGDGGVVGGRAGADDPVADVPAAVPLDASAGSFAGGAGIQQERGHHGRVVTGRTPAIGPIARPQRGEVDLLDRVEAAPDQIVGGQPVAQRDRHEVQLVALHGSEVVAHLALPDARSLERIVADRSPRPAVCATACRPNGSGAGRIRALDR
jgi:hypothetical protein